MLTPSLILLATALTDSQESAVSPEKIVISSGDKYPIPISSYTIATELDDKIGNVTLTSMSQGDQITMSVLASNLGQFVIQIDASKFEFLQHYPVDISRANGVPSGFLLELPYGSNESCGAEPRQRPRINLRFSPEGIEAWKQEFDSQCMLLEPDLGFDEFSVLSMPDGHQLLRKPSD